MAKKISDFLKNLIVKAGGNIEDEKIKAALAAISADAELGDDITNAIDHGLISLTNAKNNHPEIKNHYFAAAYNGLDSELERVMTEEGFSPELISEIKNEKSSTKRAGLLATKIKELERSKAGQGVEETKALNAKIVELNNLLRAEKDSITGVKTEYERKLRDKDKGYAMRNLLSGYKTIHDSLDAETKDIIVNAIIDKNLKSKGYKLDVDDNSNLVIMAKDGNTAFGDDHRAITPKAFLDKVMADENLLVVSGNNQNNQNGNNNQNNNSGRNQNNGNNNNNLGGNNNNRNNNNNQNQGNNGGGNAVLRELVNQTQKDLANASNSGNLF